MATIEKVKKGTIQESVRYTKREREREREREKEREREGKRKAFCIGKKSFSPHKIVCHYFVHVRM